LEDDLGAPTRSTSLMKEILVVRWRDGGYKNHLMSLQIINSQGMRGLARGVYWPRLD